MIIQESLIERIKSYIEQLKRENALSDCKLKVVESKSTKSIYVVASTKVNDKTLVRRFRISDHRNSKIPTKIICRATNFELIRRRIKSLIKELEKKRFQELLNGLHTK